MRYKLIDATTGEEIALPCRRRDFRGEEATIINFQPGVAPSTGRVMVDSNAAYYPSVYGLKIVEKERVMPKLEGKHFAYYVPEIPNGNSVPNGIAGHYYPGIAIAEEPGSYYVTDWDWSTDKATAQECAAEKNAALGLTKEDADQIIMRSMFGRTAGVKAGGKAGQRRS